MNPVSWISWWLVGVYGLGGAWFAREVSDCLVYRRFEPDEMGDFWASRPWRQVPDALNRCISCGERRRGLDGVPLVSSLLDGRCPRCGVPLIKWRLLIELSVVVLVLLGWAFADPLWVRFVLLTSIPGLVAVVAINVRTTMVPTRLVWPALAAMVAVTSVEVLVSGRPAGWVWGLVGLLVTATPITVIWLALPGGVGFGLVRLAATVGWLVGVSSGAAGGGPARVVRDAVVVCVVAALLAAFGVSVAALRGRPRNDVPAAAMLVLPSIAAVLSA